eukprot:Platyproteum_vivax@DN7378_c0_g1_i1.p1
MNVSMCQLCVYETNWLNSPTGFWARRFKERLLTSIEYKIQGFGMLNVGKTHTAAANFDGEAIVDGIVSITGDAEIDNKVAKMAAVYSFSLTVPTGSVSTTSNIKITNADLNFTDCKIAGGFAIGWLQVARGEILRLRVW